jgi:hypothetical protein
MKKEGVGCFICKMPVKARLFTFYSGVMKGGSTTRLKRRIVTVLEFWQNLTMHEIHVCRFCQMRAWRRKQLLPMILFGAGAALMFLFVLGGLALMVVDLLFGLFVATLSAFVALVLTAGFAFFAWRSFLAKPSHAQLEPAIIDAAIPLLPRRGHTYMTSEQYVERHQQGII